MERLTSLATKKLLSWLTGDGGLAKVLSFLSNAAPDLAAGQFLTQQIKPDVVEKSLAVTYPLVLVYCARLQNKQLEKFRSFSGTLEMAIELKSSAAGLDGLSDELQLLVDGVLTVLQEARGDWGDGIFYGGRYEVVFGAARQGGKGFVQDAKVLVELGGSLG